jgi:uncharacterized metal-binding protein
VALLWWPYRRVLSHRSAISHTPLVGSAGRLVYLATAAALAVQLLHPFGGPSTTEVVAALGGLWHEQRSTLLATLVGLEASAWLHLLQDGDPWPRLPRPLRRLWRLRRRLRG